MRNRKPRAKPGPARKLHSRRAADRGAMETRRPAVLCVQQRNGDEIKRLLRALRAPLRLCASGLEAIDAARAGSPLTCAIAPLQMADMGANTLIESLREIAPGLAVIIIVDNPAVSEAVAVMKSGAHAVVDSRILSTGLLRHLAPLLRNHQIPN